MAAARSSLEDLSSRIIACSRCKRLRAYSAEVARVRRRAYAGCEYWGKPVPSFGDPRARVLALGLAPGAHGSNRTGRMFTGDGSGYFFYPVLHEAGFASQSLAVSRDCAPFLDEEIGLLKNLRVVVCLGKIAFDGFLAHARRTGQITSRSRMTFAHGAEFTLPNGVTVLASYHPSQQNTNTGKLTKPMLLEIFQRARKLAGLS